MTAQDQIEQYVQRVQASTTESRNIDLEEERIVQEFCSTGCGCKLLKGRECSSQFTQVYTVVHPRK